MRSTLASKSAPRYSIVFVGIVDSPLEYFITNPRTVKNLDNSAYYMVDGVESESGDDGNGYSRTI